MSVYLVRGPRKVAETDHEGGFPLLHLWDALIFRITVTIG